MKAIGIDIGGMSAKLGLVSESRIERWSSFPTESDLDYDRFLEQISLHVKELCKGETVSHIGISSCGLIDRRRGMIVYSNNIRWENKHIAEDLSGRIGLPVAIANDAKCAALAEAVYGSGKPYRRFCMVTLGTGVGGGYIVGKKLPSADLYGDGDSVFGHITVSAGGRSCTCGRRGCLEAYVSATAVMKRYEQLTGRKLTAKEIFDRVRSSEAEACQVYDEFVRYLGEGLTDVVNILRPQCIAVGGGMAGSADLFIRQLEEYVNRHAFGANALPVKLTAAVLGNDAGMIGAVLLNESKMSVSED